VYTTVVYYILHSTGKYNTGNRLGCGWLTKNRRTRRLWPTPCRNRGAAGRPFYGENSSKNTFSKIFRRRAIFPEEASNDLRANGNGLGNNRSVGGCLDGVWSSTGTVRDGVCERSIRQDGPCLNKSVSAIVLPQRTCENVFLTEYYKTYKTNKRPVYTCRGIVLFPRRSVFVFLEVRALTRQ